MLDALARPPARSIGRMSTALRKRDTTHETGLRATKSSALAGNVIWRGSIAGTTRVSQPETWLAATRAPPVRGTCSRPRTRGRSSTRMAGVKSPRLKNVYQFTRPPRRRPGVPEP